MIQFIAGIVLGWYVATICISGAVTKVNAGVDYVQEAAANASQDKK